MIIREWRCADCSQTFESSENPEDVVCPHCTADEPERVFLTAPSVRDQKTTRTDTIVKELAADYGISNMTNKYGEPVKKPKDSPAAPQFSQNNEQMMQRLQQLGKGGDNFSGVGGVFANRGPRTWNKVPAARK